MQLARKRHSWGTAQPNWTGRGATTRSTQLDCCVCRRLLQLDNSPKVSLHCTQVNGGGAINFLLITHCPRRLMCPNEEGREVGFCLYPNVVIFYYCHEITLSVSQFTLATEQRKHSTTPLNSTMMRIGVERREWGKSSLPSTDTSD